MLKSELVKQLHLFPLSVEDVPSACVCVYRGDIWLGSLLGLCNVSIWCVCLSGLQNGGSQIVRGKVMSTSSDERESG